MAMQLKLTDVCLNSEGTEGYFEEPEIFFLIGIFPYEFTSYQITLVSRKRYLCPRVIFFFLLFLFVLSKFKIEIETNTFNKQVFFPIQFHVSFLCEYQYLMKKKTGKHLYEIWYILKKSYLVIIVFFYVLESRILLRIHIPM